MGLQQNYRPGLIRNVVLLSHSGAGKTSLSEAMLFLSGAITRLGRVDDGNTTSDYDPEEVKRKIGINLSIIPCWWKEHKINVLDTPGYEDFIGEVIAGIRVADGAVIVVSAASGVEVGTERVWRLGEEKALPCLVFLNKMDRENASFTRVVEGIQSRLGKKCLPLQMPIGVQSEFQGIVDLVPLKAYSGSPGQEGELPPSLRKEAESWRERLVEAVAELQDDLTVKYLEGQEITPEEIYQALRQGVRARKIMPILVGSALKSIGIPFLSDAITTYLPAPDEGEGLTALNPLTQKEESVKRDGTAPLVALVFKTSADPYVGKLSYLRVYSGSLSSNSPVWNATRGQAERIGQLMVLRGKTQEPVPQLIAGDIGAVAKLAVTSTGDTLSTKERPFTLPAIQSPPPIYGLALHPKTKADVDKLGTILPRLVEEDPTLQVRKELDTGEIVLSGLGDTQVEVAIERLQRKFGVEVKAETPRVPYKETILVPIKAEYKHKKQTGGHGQYGHVLVNLEPLPRGEGKEFTARVVGGAVPKNYIPGVEKGVMEALQEGILARYPVVDIRVTLYDGSYHPVDSSDISFKIAGAQAVKKGLAQGQPVLLEPVMRLKVLVPDTFTGDVIGDLNTKRAKVLGMLPQDGSQVIEAYVPLAEVLRYAIDLRSITQGRGSYGMEFSHYEEVPAHLTQKIIAARQAEKG